MTETPAGAVFGAAPTVGVPELADWLRRFAALVAAAKDELTALDAAIGDADHGVNLDRGLQAVVARLPELGAPGATPASLLKGVALTLISTVGGASGPLYGTFFLRLAGSLGDAPAVGPGELAAGLRAGLDGMAERGRTQLDDKTMVDALAPAIAALAAGLPAAWDEALARSVAAGAAGRDRVTPLVARKGRASYLGERSAGHQDPGATSAVLLLEALRDALAPAGAPG